LVDSRSNESSYYPNKNKTTSMGIVVSTLEGAVLATIEELEGFMEKQEEPPLFYGGNRDNVLLSNTLMGGTGEEEEEEEET